MEHALTLALNYRCNSNCGFCFLKPERAAPPEDTRRTVIEKIFLRNAGSRRYKRLIISGAEATLRPDLAEIAAAALSRGGFSVVRLQTNGRRLADAGYCRGLVSSGITEFQVSVHADTPALDARVTGVQAAFAQTRAGLRNILACGAGLAANTVVTRQNYARLPGIAAYLLSEGVRKMQFWSFVELEGAAQSSCQVSLRKSVPKLLAALALLEKAGAETLLSWFPECLLGPYGALLRNYSSPTVICREFKRRMEGLGDFSCYYSGACSRFGKSCLGLHRAYIETFSDERDLLTPLAGRRGKRKP